MADCLIRDDCFIRVYGSVTCTRVQKSGQALPGLAVAVPQALLHLLPLYLSQLAF